MKKLQSFLLLSLDGYIADPNGDTSWAHGPPDPDFDAMTRQSATGGGPLLMGRKTYETMRAFWPTAQAKKEIPEVARGMNDAKKFVFSRTLTKLDWENTVFVKGDLAKEVEKLKREAEKDITILGSGSLVTELAQAGLVDAFQFVVSPVALGAGIQLFAGLDGKLELVLESSKAFKNGMIVSSYVPRAKKR